MDKKREEGCIYTLFGYHIHNGVGAVPAGAERAPPPLLLFSRSESEATAESEKKKKEGEEGASPLVLR